MNQKLLVVSVVFAGMAIAQGPPPGGPMGGSGRGPGGRGPMPPAKNLKVLTQDSYLGVMFGMQTALGQRCEFCHEEDRSLDEKPTKLTARRMMGMVKNINDTMFNGEAKVSCWTCHRGEQKPAPTPAPQFGPPGGGRGGSGGRGPGGPGMGPGMGPGGPGMAPGGAPAGPGRAQ